LLPKEGATELIFEQIDLPNIPVRRTPSVET